jgi:hypothetical protein
MDLCSVVSSCCTRLYLFAFAFFTRRQVFVEDVDAGFQFCNCTPLNAVQSFMIQTCTSRAWLHSVRYQSTCIQCAVCEPSELPEGVSNGEVLGEKAWIVSTSFSWMIVACLATEADL